MAETRPISAEIYIRVGRDLFAGADGRRGMVLVLIGATPEGSVFGTKSETLIGRETRAPVSEKIARLNPTLRAYFSWLKRCPGTWTKSVGSGRSRGKSRFVMLTLSSSGFNPMLVGGLRI